MNFSSKSIVAVILVILALGLGYFGVMPRWSAYSQAKDQLKVEQETQKKLLDAQEQMQSFLNDYKQHTAEATALNNALPLSEDQIYNVLKSLEDFSKASGMSLANLGFLERPQADQLGAESNSIQPIDVNLTVSGSYASFKSFLTKLESNLRIIDVQSVDLKVNENSNSITYQTSFRTYYQK